MLRIAIVEDDPSAADKLQALIQQYCMKRDQKVTINRYQNAVNFLNNYHPVFDVIFMDIQMPFQDGLTAATKLREIDQTTLLIFVTNLANYAIKGYAVSAFDYLVKPVAYSELAAKMERAMDHLAHNIKKRIIILSEGARVLLEVSDIYYVEVSDHQLIYHTRSDNYQVRGTIKKAKEELESAGFFLCNSCYLVNMKYVQRVEKYIVIVNETPLQISHPKKKAFLEALNDYIGNLY